MFALQDFFIGFFLANSLPHFVAGFAEIRFLSLFGFSAKGNIIYSVWNLFLASAIGYFFYGTEFFTTNGYFIGGATILILYYLSGRFLYVRWHIEKKKL